VPGCTHFPVLNSEPARIKPRVWDAPAPLRLWHVASLDAPTVALVWSWGFAWAARVHLHAWAPLALCLIAWAVYIADRLLDAHAGMQFPPLHILRERHVFHWRYRRALAPIGLLAAAAAARLVFTRLPAGARLPDTALAAATLAYFSGVHTRGRFSSRIHGLISPFSSRAFLIGVLFTAGCLLPVASQLAHAGTPAAAQALALPALFFACLGWLNCHAIGKWESRGGAQPSRPRGREVLRPRGRETTNADSRTGTRPTWLIGISGALLALLLSPAEPRAAALLAAGAASAFLLGLLDRYGNRLTPLALRAAADLVLLTPALLFFIRQ
jgi:hypothetical protein